MKYDKFVYIIKVIASRCIQIFDNSLLIESGTPVICENRSGTYDWPMSKIDHWPTERIGGRKLLLTLKEAKKC